MSTPDYMRTFDLCTEICGWLKWPKYNGLIFHACSPDDAATILSASAAIPKSRVHYISTAGNPAVFRGLWVTLNDYVEGYQFGPILFRWPSAVLKDKIFIVIKRNCGRERIIFIEYTHGTKTLSQWNELSTALFSGDYELKPNTTYNLVLTSQIPVEIGSTVVRGCAHCGISDERQGQEEARRLGERFFAEWLRIQEGYAEIIRTYPDLVGHHIRLSSAAESEIDEIDDLDSVLRSLV